MAVHSLSKDGIRRFALQKRAAGELYDLRHEGFEDTFRGSIDRYCDIALAFRDSPRVVDAGSGNGLFLALLKLLGHDVVALDFVDHRDGAIYVQHGIPSLVCNLEAGALPLEAESVDALACSQALEHFTHSHLAPLLQMKRVLKPGGVIEIDVPNVAAFRNRSRLLRGKHITYDYEKYYLDPKPIVHEGREYYPQRHNREFTRDELALLLAKAGFRDVDVRFLKSRRYRTGFEQLKSIGTALKDAIPSLRKSLIAFARK